MSIDNTLHQKNSYIHHESDSSDKKMARVIKSSTKSTQDLQKEPVYSSILTKVYDLFASTKEICYNYKNSLFFVGCCKIDDSVDFFINSPEKYILFVENHVVKAQKKKEERHSQNNYNFDRVIEVVNNCHLISYELLDLLQEHVDAYNKEHQLVTKKILILRNPRNEFIHKFILNHLKPYFEGKITEETEDTQRKPLIEPLLNTLKAAFPHFSFDKREVENFALKIYVAEAANEFNRSVLRCNPGMSFFTDPDKSDDEELVKDFCEELRRAVRLDFQDPSLSDDDINELGQGALDDILKKDQERKTRNKARKKLKKASKKGTTVEKEKNEQWDKEIAALMKQKSI